MTSQGLGRCVFKGRQIRALAVVRRVNPAGRGGEARWQQRSGSCRMPQERYSFLFFRRARQRYGQRAARLTGRCLPNAGRTDGQVRTCRVDPDDTRIESRGTTSSISGTQRGWATKGDGLRQLMAIFHCGFRRFVRLSADAGIEQTASECKHGMLLIAW